MTHSPHAEGPHGARQNAGSGHHRAHPQVHSITDADESHSSEMHSRMVKYTISMSVRLACFVAAFFTSGIWQWVFLFGAIFLPWFAVVIANGGADRNRHAPSTTLLDASPHPALGAVPGASRAAGNAAAGGTGGAATGEGTPPNSGQARTDHDPAASGHDAAGAGWVGPERAGPEQPGSADGDASRPTLDILEGELFDAPHPHTGRRRHGGGQP